MRGQRISKEFYAEMHAKHLQGKGLADLSKEYNIRLATIYYGFKRLGFEVYKATNEQRRKKSVIDDNWFSVIDTQEKAYFLGLLMADGCIVKGKNGKSDRVCLKLKKEDRYLVDLFAKLVAPGNVVYEEHNSCVAQIPSNKIVSDLQTIGLQVRKTTVGETFPKLVDELRFHFLRGYFDGDGSISLGSQNRSTIYICSVTVLFLMDVRSFLDEFGINTSLYREDRPGRNMYTLHIRSRIKFYHKLYKDASIFMIRKKLRYDHVNTVLTRKKLEA